MSRITIDQLRDAVLDEGSFVSWDVDPLPVPMSSGYARALADARTASGRDESVSAGEGRVFGRRVAVVVCDFTFLAGSIGVAIGAIIGALTPLSNVERDGLHGVADKTAKAAADLAERGADAVQKAASNIVH